MVSFVSVSPNTDDFMLCSVLSSTLWSLIRSVFSIISCRFLLCVSYVYGDDNCCLTRRWFFLAPSLQLGLETQRNMVLDCAPVPQSEGTLFGRWCGGIARSKTLINAAAMAKDGRKISLTTGFDIINQCWVCEALPSSMRCAFSGQLFNSPAGGRFADSTLSLPGCQRVAVEPVC